MSFLDFFASDAFLWGLWDLAVALALASAALALGLVVYRAFSLRSEQRRDARQQKLTRFFMVALDSPVSLTPDSVPKLDDDDLDLVVTIALNLLRPLQGGDILAIIQLLLLWEIPDFLNGLLNHGSRLQKIRALTLLSFFDGDDALMTLLDYIEDPDPYVQLAALRGAALRGGDAAVGEIVNAIENSKMAHSLFLADILSLFHEESLPFIHRLAEKDKSENVRLAAVRAIGVIRSLSSIDPLLKILASGNPTLKQEALRALENIGDVRGAEVIISCLDDPNLGVRLQATQALGKIRYTPAIPFFSKGLTSPDWWLRYRSAEALFYINEAGGALLRSLASKSDLAGLTCLQFLAERGQSS